MKLNRISITTCVVLLSSVINLSDNSSSKLPKFSSAHAQVDIPPSEVLGTDSIFLDHFGFTTDYNEAEKKSLIDNGIEALKIYRQVNDKEKEQRTIMQLCGLSQEINDEEKISEYCDEPEASESQSPFYGLPDAEGLQLVQAQKYDEAIEYYHKAINLELERQKDYKKRGIDSTGSDYDLRKKLGWSYLYAGKFNQAEDEFNQAFKFEERHDELVATYGEYPGENIFAALQKLKIKQGKIEEALEIAESGRTRLLNKQVSKTKKSLTIKQIKDIAKKQNSTLVFYSVITDDMKPMLVEDGDYSKPLDNLYIWVVNPQGKVNFRELDLTLSKEKVSYLFVYQATALLSSLLMFGITINRYSKYKIKSSFVLVALFFCFISISCSSDVQDIETVYIDELINQASNEDYIFSFESLTENTLSTVKSNGTEVYSDSTLKQTCKYEQECLQQLYQLTIEPIANLLPSEENEQVIFIPDGELFKVPFPALIDSEGKHLVEKHTIRTSPSIKLFQLIDQLSKQQKPNASVDSALVVGNPIMPEVIKNRFKDAEGLEQLPATEQEAIQIAQILNTKPLLGVKATESEVFKRMPESTIIHLATHGIQNTRAPAVGLYETDLLTLTPQETELEVMKQQFYSSKLDYYPYDGLLTQYDISTLDLSNTDLVVLSACETGIGRITRDGVNGIARPFLTAGANSVVVSLWQVPDSPTAELMVEFYQNLKSTENKAQALRQAMLTIKEKYPEPYNWAAFTLVGEAI